MFEEVVIHLHQQTTDAQTNHRTGIMGETMSSGNWDNIWNNNWNSNWNYTDDASNIFYNTTSGSDDITLTASTTTLTGSPEGMCFSYSTEPIWMPYHEIKYIPKWHIKLGYKNQIKIMWN